jgi:hypothetical protein
VSVAEVGAARAAAPVTTTDVMASSIADMVVTAAVIVDRRLPALDRTV